MHRIQNEAFSLAVDDCGRLIELYQKQDKQQMNWMIEPGYLDECGYPDHDKLTGCFAVIVEGRKYTQHESRIAVRRRTAGTVEATYSFPCFTIVMSYSVHEAASFNWTIAILNEGEKTLRLDGLNVWLSLAYVMFRDPNVQRNMSQSCALFPSLSTDFTRLAAVRRNDRGPHLGIFNTKGRTLSLGSYCRFENRFLEQVSPSLDGLIFHTLVLVGTQESSGIGQAGGGWIYPKPRAPLALPPGESQSWSYSFLPVNDRRDFGPHGVALGFPAVEYTPVLVKNGLFAADLVLPTGQRIESAVLERAEREKSDPRTGRYSLVRQDVTAKLQPVAAQKYRLERRLADPGEYKLVLRLGDGREDFVVFSVLEPIKEIIEARVKYLCEHSFDEDARSEHPYAFRPVSNQGESLGKLSMILMKNRLGDPAADEIAKAESSAVRYVLPRWFHEGNFARPRKLYGTFYRIFDLDYIAHIFFLLSRMDERYLRLHSPKTYLRWSAEILTVRFDQRQHRDQREQRETGLAGAFTHYLPELLAALREDPSAESAALYERLSFLYRQFGVELKRNSEKYTGAITEHYFDNAGFGPSCEALCLMGHTAEARKYGELLLANIGFSNDYRAQNPDRWWEGLAYMIHSLWGGLAANACLTAYEHFGELDYLRAAYRSIMPVFYCYDWNACSSERLLDKGEAASTYCVPDPNLNMPALSRNRFGQSVFRETVELLAGNATGDDWDMGEEVAAYLSGFGTKTFLYLQDGGIKCINGWTEPVDDGVLVTSYAAYPKEFYFYDKSRKLIADEGEILPQVFVDREFRIRRVSEVELQQKGAFQ
ncbi:hypothetical protein [Paenibacillus macerans]|uniref:hypothetical protein n=1 Tax=Paenibacillus macerans TaxID=44252 RepID=UPI003D31000E